MSASSTQFTFLRRIPLAQDPGRERGDRYRHLVGDPRDHVEVDALAGDDFDPGKCLRALHRELLDRILRAELAPGVRLRDSTLARENGKVVSKRMDVEEKSAWHECSMDLTQDVHDVLRFNSSE